MAQALGGSWQSVESYADASDGNFGKTQYTLAFLKGFMILYYLLIALTPFLNPPLVWRLFGNTGTFKILGAICVLYALVEIGRKGRIPAYFRTWQARLFLVLFLLATVSFLSMGQGTFFQNSTLLTYLDFVVFFFVTLSVVNTPRRLRAALIASVIGITYGSADIIREWLSMHKYNPWYRAGDIVGDGNYFSTSASLILPFVFLMIFNSKKLSGKALFLGCLLISLTAITLTGSRGGALAVAISILYVIWYSQHRVRNLALVGVLTIPLLILVPASPLYRFLHPTAHGINTEQTRLEAWVAGLKMFETHPFFGVGLGNFKSLMPEYAPPNTDFQSIAHNTYIEYLAEMGPFGLFLFVGVTSCAFFSLRKVRKSTRDNERSGELHLAAFSLEAGLFGYLVGALFLSAEYDKLLWVAIFLSACLSSMVPSLRRAGLQARDIETTSSTVEIGLREVF